MMPAGWQEAPHRLTNLRCRGTIIEPAGSSSGQVLYRSGMASPVDLGIGVIESGLPPIAESVAEEGRQSRRLRYCSSEAGAVH